ncbi:MAG: tRNA1(Val) (adenine(37)-N6)-methyltransferase [Veillonellales bacterium]
MWWKKKIMNEVPLNPGERLDDLLINDLKIIQHEAEFCFSLDAVLLAHFTTLKLGTTVVDLGTGTGVIPLLLTTRGAGRITGVELNEKMADMAARSVRLNGLDGQIQIRQGDFRQMKGLLPAGETGLVVANPPYRPVGGGFLNPRDSVAMARHEVTANLQDVVAAARYLVKFRGRVAMVHLPERLAEVLKVMSDSGIEPKRLQLVYPAVQRKPNILLVEGVRGARPGLDVLPPLVIYKNDGSYSDEILEYYK